MEGSEVNDIDEKDLELSSEGSDVDDVDARSPDESPDYTEVQKYLNKLLSKCKVKSAEVGTTANLVKYKIETLIKTMQEKDEIFKNMYTRYRLRGSTDNKLKVMKPNEFDLDVELDLKKRLIEYPNVDDIFPELGAFKVTVSKDFPSWAECKINPDQFDWGGNSRNKRKKCHKNLFDKEGRLKSMGLRSWMHSLVSTSIEKLIVDPPMEIFNPNETNRKDKLKWDSLIVTPNGPAITLKSKVSDLSIDLVATVKVPEYCKKSILKNLEDPKKVGIKFSTSSNAAETSKPSRKNRPPVVIKEEDLKECYLVPVEPRVALGSDPPPRHLLRLSMPLLEERLIRKGGSLKDTIRLLKVLRDNNMWDPIASFFLVNLCIGTRFEKGKDPTAKTLSDQNNLGLIFFKVLGRLAEALKSGELPLPWAPGCNLFIKLKPEFRMNARYRISGFLHCFEQDVDQMKRDNFTYVGKEKNVSKFLESFFKDDTSYKDNDITNKDAETSPV